MTGVKPKGSTEMIGEVRRQIKTVTEHNREMELNNERCNNIVKTYKQEEMNAIAACTKLQVKLKKLERKLENESRDSSPPKPENRFFKYDWKR